MNIEKRQAWGSRMTFILAAIGSAVGLGNAWRFPGLAAKHGGGSFLFAYLICMIIMGIPLLMMEVAIGRKTRKGAPEALRALNKKLEPIGWAATANSFAIVCYYAVIFAWVILMALISFKFAGMTGNTEAAQTLWSDTIATTWNFTGFDYIPTIVLVCLLIAWVAIFMCIRNGASSVGKVVKFTVFTPEICLLIMAVKGLFMPGGLEGLKVFVTPVWSHMADATLWVDAAGQVFYSLSIMMAIMFAYGSFLKKDSNIAVDTIIIALSDFITSFLSGVVLFTTMYGVGMTTDNMSASGIKTAFIIYPTAIVNLTDSGIFNAVFAFIFYLCLITLAIDSAFSIVEGISTAVADKFKLNHKKTTLGTCIIAGLISVVMTTGAGFAIVDVVDNWCNTFNLVIIGVLESVAVGMCFKTSKVLEEVNKNTKKFKMPAWLFNISIKFASPIILTGLVVWNVITLIQGGGLYGGYSLAANIICGWALTFLVFASGFIVMLIVHIKKKKGFVENEVNWDDNNEDVGEKDNGAEIDNSAENEKNENIEMK